MTNSNKDALKAAILKFKTDRFSFGELRSHFPGDYESLKTSVFELLEEPSPVVKQVFDKKAKTMQLVRVKR
jgi:type I restriction enzyme, S subunit